VGAFLFASPAQALSWPLCENGGQVWVTERPQTEPQFPGANLWFFCEGSLNILGNAIDACVPSKNGANGTVCVPQVGNAICQLLGYESAFPDDTVIAVANASEPVVSLTGEYCIRKGQYSKTLPDNLASIPGEPCSKIEKLTCIRTLDTLAAALSLGLQTVDLDALQPAPAAEDLPTTARLAQQAAVQAEMSTTIGTSGRKLLLS